MTGFTGFENLFRPLHSPLFLCFFSHPSPPPSTVEIMKAGTNGGRGGGVRVIAVIPELLQRAQAGRKRRPGALMWMDLTGSQPITQRTASVSPVRGGIYNCS